MISTGMPDAQTIRDLPHQMTDKVKESMSCTANQMQETIEKHPTASVMVGLGVGFAAGMMLACAYRNSSSHHHMLSQNYAQRVGQRVMDSLRDVVPSQWMDRLHS